MLKNNFFDLALGFLFHKSEYIRQKILLVIVSLTRKYVGCGFLMQPALIEKLFKMIKNDTPQIKIRAFEVLAYFKADDQVKLKFWMEKDIVEEVEILLLNVAVT